MHPDQPQTAHGSVRGSTIGWSSHQPSKLSNFPSSAWCGRHLERVGLGPLWGGSHPADEITTTPSLVHCPSSIVSVAQVRSDSLGLDEWGFPWIHTTCQNQHLQDCIFVFGGRTHSLGLTIQSFFRFFGVVDYDLARGSVGRRATVMPLCHMIFDLPSPLVLLRSCPRRDRRSSLISILASRRSRTGNSMTVMSEDKGQLQWM
jgi:hypothetical protein